MIDYLIDTVVSSFTLKNVISAVTLVVTTVSFIKRDDIFAFSKKKVLRLFMHSFFSEMKTLKGKIQGNHFKFKELSPASLITTVDIVESQIKKNIYGIVDGTYGDLKNFSALNVLVQTVSRDFIHELESNPGIEAYESKILLAKMKTFVPDLKSNYHDIAKSPLKLNYLDTLDMVLLLITILVHNILFEFIER